LAKRIRLIVSDIDGCLSRGSTTHYSPALLGRLAKVNARSRTDPLIPAITYCTGRPQPYVECLLQATGGYMPALCEGGAVFFDPVHHTVSTHEGFGPREQAVLQELRQDIRCELIGDSVMFEPGKVTHITLLIAPPKRPEDYLSKAATIADRFGDEFMVETTRICVHILFRHLHKGTGIDWLVDHTGIDTSEMAGIGDAAPDIPFLERVGLAFAPSNADEEVKRVCHVDSDRPDYEASLEFIDHVIEYNSAVARGEA
jgi:hydroxymethylpyrimidine pyrophosphatase-like HAD family hydrolase